MRDGRFADAIGIWQVLLAWQDKTHFSDDFLAIDTRLFDLQAYDGLATCCFRMGDFKQARHYYQLAAQCSPKPLEYQVKKQLCNQLMTQP